MAARRTDLPVKLATITLAGPLEYNAASSTPSENVGMFFLRALFLAILPIAMAHADEVKVAVASNFTGPMQVISVLFERDTGHKVEPGFRQHREVLCADRQWRPLRGPAGSGRRDTGPSCCREGGAVAGSNFTYAIGKLVLWSADPQRVDATGEVRKRGDFRHLAVANPKTPPTALRRCRQWTNSASWSP